MGHLETAVRILAMLARGGGCATFEERLDLLLQAYYFLGRMASTVTETVACGHRYRLYEEAVPEGPERSKTPFEEWWNTSRVSGKCLKRRSEDVAILFPGFNLIDFPPTFPPTSLRYFLLSTSLSNPQHACHPKGGLHFPQG